MEIIIGLIIFFLVIVIMFFANYNDRKNYIDFFSKNLMEKLATYNYSMLEIKRKRRPQRLDFGRTRFTEYPLEKTIPVSPFIITPEDIIEIFGINENNKKRLIFKTEWSLEKANYLKNIIEKINDEKRRYCT